MQGDKVKFSLQFRGREMQFQEEGSKMFQVNSSHIKMSTLQMFPLRCTQQPLQQGCLARLSLCRLASCRVWSYCLHCSKGCCSNVYSLPGISRSACSFMGQLSRCSSMQRFMEDLKDNGTIENQPSMQGRTMYMIIGPQKV